MRVAIIGSRSFEDKEFIYNKLDGLLDITKHITVVSGGAKGVDSLAQEYAADRGYDFVLYKPYHLVDNRTKFEPKFFFSRNRQIVDNCDMLIAFWDGESRGTAHAIQFAEKRGKDVEVVEV